MLTIQQDKSTWQVHRFRLSLLVALIIILSLVLVLRLAFLQLSQYTQYATLSLKNQMKILPIAPPRGIIVDRNGVILADNIPVYVLELVPERVKQLDATLTALQALIPSITDDDLKNFHRACHQNRKYMSIPLKLNLSQEEVAIFASNQYRFSGVSIKPRLMRYYPLADVTAHLLGYVSRINVQELQHVDNINYQGTNFIGKTGIEQYYEDTLHGQVGYQQTETDVSGRTLRTLSRQAPVSGNKLVLTIDARLQQVAYDAMKDNRGAVVVMNARNGDILTMISSPSYDPNVFVNGISHQAYQQLATSPDKPLYNRAVRGLYPPASTIKPYMAIAGLEKQVITEDTRIYDPGWYTLPGISHHYRDFKRSGHGFVNVTQAITVSCDTFFYQLSNKMGIAAMEDMLMKFGFGQRTQVDLNEEAAGVLPSPYWKRQTKGVSWYPGDTIITSIGQGFMLATPLQIANAATTLSQHGRRYRPHLLGQSLQGNNVPEPYKPLEEYPIQLKQNHYWDIITKGMQGVIKNNEGTGLRFGRNPPYTVAGKTGTAQVFSSNGQLEKTNARDIPAALRDHSLFIAFAPIENPEVAIAVVVEHDVLAPNVARQILDSYFEQQSRQP